MKGILGRKAGMTQVFTKDGKLIPVTVIEVEPNVVMQVKTVEKDGYNAIQLGVFEKKEKQANKPEMGNAKKANTTPKRFLKEIRDVESTYNIGDTVSAGVFTVGEVVDVTGTSKGKGFQGVIKRHNQSRGPMTHGSHYHRRPGSLGTMLPKRVLKGKKLAGHMGVDTVTIQNLEIIEVNEAENYILVSGNVPGAKNSLVLIKTAVKNSRKSDSTRQGTRKTKNRSEVSGGGRKPWRQKGTGRARQGSIRATQWRGGGIPMGVGPRDYTFKINKKERVIALKSALSSKVQEKALVVVDSFNMKSTKTKDAIKMLEGLKLDNKILFVTSDDAENLYLAVRNLPNVLVIYADEVNCYDLVNADVVVMDEAAISKIEEVLK